MARREAPHLREKVCTDCMTRPSARHPLDFSGGREIRAYPAPAKEQGRRSTGFFTSPQCGERSDRAAIRVRGRAMPLTRLGPAGPRHPLPVRTGRGKKMAANNTGADACPNVPRRPHLWPSCNTFRRFKPSPRIFPVTPRFGHTLPRTRRVSVQRRNSLQDFKVFGLAGPARQAGRVNSAAIIGAGGTTRLWTQKPI